MNSTTHPLIDWPVFERTRSMLGANFHRVFGYLVEDGERSIVFLERAIRDVSAVQLVLPAHCLKGEALHFGAQRLAALAAHIEYTARDYVELRIPPVELIAPIAHLRPVFKESIAELRRATSPLQQKRRAA